MANDRVDVNGHQGRRRGRAVSETLDQIGLLRLAEGANNDGANGRDVVRALVTNRDHPAHPPRAIRRSICAR